MQKAIEEFRQETRDLGLRPDSPKRKTAGGGFGAWHGRIFENIRNDFLDAIPHEVRQRGSQQSTLRRNQFGFNVAGPLVFPKLHDGNKRTYLSLSYEGVRERISRSFLRTVPIAPERTGDFSRTVDAAGNSLPIYDPASTQPNPAFDASQAVSTANLEYARTPFPGNVVPLSLLDPVARKALGLYPDSNIDVGPFHQNNFFVQSPETNRANGMIAKVQHSLRSRHRINGGLSFSNGLQASARWFPNAANPGPTDRVFNSRRMNVEHVFTVSPRTVNSAGFEASADRSQSGDDDRTDYVAALGLRGPLAGSFPVFSLGRYLGMGQASPNSRDASAYFRLWDSFSTRRGKHNLRVFAEIAQHQINSFQPVYASGRFGFSSGPTSLPGIINTGHEFATFLLGLVNDSQVGIVTSPSYFRRHTGRVSLSDSVEPVQGLILSASLNLEGASPRVDKYDRQSTVDLDAINPATGTKGAMIVAGRGQSRAFQPARYFAEPSFSFAWTPGAVTKTTFRGSYSRSYAAPPMGSGQWGTQAFNGTPTIVPQNSQLQPAFKLSDGLPALPQTFPDLGGDAVNDQTADLFESSGATAVYQSFGFSAQRELSDSTIVTLSLNQGGGRDLFIDSWNGANLNAPSLGTLQYRDELYNRSFLRSLRPYPQYLGFDVNGTWPRGHYQRDSASVRLEKRASRGLVVSSSYEFSKQMDDYSSGAQDVYNSNKEWSLTTWDSPHRVSLSINYELPIGSNGKLLAFSDWRRHLADGWSLSAVSSFNSGRPLSLYPQFNNTGGVVPSLRVNVVPGVDPAVEDPGPEAWFNPAAFAQPADFTIGNASRTHPTLRGPDYQNHDLSITKRFALSGDETVEFTAVGLNFLNHANWNYPDTTIGPESAPNLNAGKIIGSSGGRVVQLGLTFSF
jgi:hypothetical protein